jgi:hypothetical protein
MPQSLRLHLPPGLGKPFWVACAILALFECALHSNSIIQRYRAVFAVGRAIDKVRYVEQNPPALLFLGNSRVDNGVDPGVIDRERGLPGASSFNLGMPGANLRIFHGLLERLERQGLLGNGAIVGVVLGLDEASLLEEDSLGYSAFFASRGALWEQGRYRDWLGSYLRLWSYSDNLRQLHEPAKALSFISATLRSVDPIGGAPATHLGYRAGFGAAQDEGQVARQEQTSHDPPAPALERLLWQMIDGLQAKQVRVAVAVLPLRDRSPAFFADDASAKPYRDLLAQLRQRGVTVVPPPAGFAADEFVNAGHLNDRGAQRYSALLSRHLAAAGI